MASVSYATNLLQDACKGRDQWGIYFLFKSKTTLMEMISIPFLASYYEKRIWNVLHGKEGFIFGESDEINAIAKQLFKSDCVKVVVISSRNGILHRE